MDFVNYQKCNLLQPLVPALFNLKLSRYKIRNFRNIGLSGFRSDVRILGCPPSHPYPSLLPIRLLIRAYLSLARSTRAIKVQVYEMPQPADSGTAAGADEQRADPRVPAVIILAAKLHRGGRDEINGEPSMGGGP
jgi:hypothetical protein